MCIRNQINMEFRKRKPDNISLDAPVQDGISFGDVIGEDCFKDYGLNEDLKTAKARALTAVNPKYWDMCIKYIEGLKDGNANQTVLCGKYGFLQPTGSRALRRFMAAYKKEMQRLGY